MINDTDFEAIAYQNAERLLDVTVSADNEVGLEIGRDDAAAAAEAERRKMPWLTPIESGISLR